MAAAFPAPLLGKSVVVTWTTDRQQVFEGESTPVYRQNNYQLSVYISSIGRAFNKMHVNSSGGGHGRGGGGHGRGRYGFGNTGDSEQGPGDRQSSTGGSRVVHFEGGALLVESQMISGALRVAVNFDAGYGSCTARVIFGKENGVQPMRARSMISGRRFEVVSLQNSAPNCAVSAGNVFGGQ